MFFYSVGKLAGICHSLCDEQASRLCAGEDLVFGNLQYDGCWTNIFEAFFLPFLYPHTASVHRVFSESFIAFL